MEVQWTSEAVEAKAQEMIVMWEPHCTTAMETVLAKHLAYLTASHLQLQEAYQVNICSVIRTNDTSGADTGDHQGGRRRPQSSASRLWRVHSHEKTPCANRGPRRKILTSTYLRHPAMDGPWRRSSGQLGPGKTSMSPPPAPCCGKAAKAAGLVTIANASLTFMPITSPWAACSGNARRGGLGDDESSDLRLLGRAEGRNQQGGGPCSTLKP